MIKIIKKKDKNKKNKNKKWRNKNNRMNVPKPISRVKSDIEVTYDDQITDNELLTVSSKKSSLRPQLSLAGGVSEDMAALHFFAVEHGIPSSEIQDANNRQSGNRQSYIMQTMATSSTNTNNIQSIDAAKHAKKQLTFYTTESEYFTLNYLTVTA
eukprot:153379_1